LNAKGRASYNAANPGKPGLKAPTARGRQSPRLFLRPDEGHESEIHERKTASNPDSRINKSLRAWNCADGGYVKAKQMVVLPKAKREGEDDLMDFNTIWSAGLSLVMGAVWFFVRERLEDVSVLSGF
jgi:hypothetical protein